MANVGTSIPFGFLALRSRLNNRRLKFDAFLPGFVYEIHHDQRIVDHDTGERDQSEQ